jgi:hypothetical protein
MLQFAWVLCSYMHGMLYGSRDDVGYQPSWTVKMESQPAEVRSQGQQHTCIGNY